MNKNECKKVIVDLMEQIRDTVYSRNHAFSALRMIFLKYALDNYIGADSKEEMQQCVRAQKMFALRDIENGIETIIPVLQHVDEAYGFDHILSHPDTIDAYGRELFGIDRTRQKKNASEDGFKELIAMLGNLDLEEKPETSIGQMIVETMLEVVETTSERNSFSAEFTTSRGISTIAKAILNVEDTDRFIDFASGTGISTLDIAGDARPQIINAEINGCNAAVAAMLYIMQGYDKLQIVCGDSIGEEIPNLQGNKLFVDAPLAMKMTRTPTNEYSDSTLAVINRVMHNYLSGDGMAVITLAGGTLFQAKRQAVGLRQEMVELGLVKAVITLPPLWNYTAVNTNLLVLSKGNKPGRDVVFIDAVQEAKKASDKNLPNALSAELIEKIVSVIENRETIEGFSCVVDREMIREKDFNLAPATYMTYPMEEETITMEEIDARLKELYRQLLQ